MCVYYRYPIQKGVTPLDLKVAFLLEIVVYLRYRTAVMDILWDHKM